MRALLGADDRFHNRGAGHGALEHAHSTNRRLELVIVCSRTLRPWRANTHDDGAGIDRDADRGGGHGDLDFGLHLCARRGLGRQAVQAVRCAKISPAMGMRKTSPIYDVSAMTVER